MVKTDNEIERDTEALLKAREKQTSTCRRDQVFIKFQIKSVVCTMVVAMVCFLAAAQLLPALSGGLDADFWSLFTSTTALEPHPSSIDHHESTLNTSSIDLHHGEVRVFKPHGLATHLYIEMSAYRGGPRAFSVVGLASKSLETHHKPAYACEWVSGSRVVVGRAHKIKPDWNYGKLYTVVVTACTFAEDVGVHGEGGDLVLYVGYGDRFRDPERIVVLTELENAYNATVFEPRYFPYDYVYCGSSVYGDISPQRMREWMAYHANLFGKKSHFILHDSGGFHKDVRKVLQPWIDLGCVTLQNIRQQEIYDGYYHNQFLVVNDCLFRSRFMANWTFFFDIDEFIYVDASTNLSAVLNRDANVTQITIPQVPMTTGMCVLEKASTSQPAEVERKWGFEKLLYQKLIIRGVHQDRKYAIQARHAAATGIHMSTNMRRGKHLSAKGMRYYHYHGTITKREDVCNIYVDSKNQTALLGYGVKLDKTMATMAKDVKSFERKTIGTLPYIL